MLTVYLSTLFTYQSDTPTVTSRSVLVHVVCVCP